LATAARKCDCYNTNGDGTSCSRCRCRGWKTGDWCWLKEKENDFQTAKEPMLAEDVAVEEEQDIALSPETTSPTPISTDPNPKRSAPPPRQTKRTIADAATFSGVEDNDGEEEYEGDSTDEWEEDCGLGNDCSDSEIQESKTKKARKGLYQETLDKKWASMFRLLIEYKDQHVNTLVPASYKQNPKLGRWVKAQRNLHSKKQLSSHRVLRLESIGFVWCVKRLIVDANWDAMFQLLLEYKDQHGNTCFHSACC